MVAVPAIKRLMLGTLLLFAAIALAATYWAVAGPYGILQREDNPRLIEAIAQIRRGGIYDRKEQLLVKSVETTGGMRRSYLRPSTFSLVGYYSLRYGSSGAEAAFNQALNGIDSPDNFENYFVRDILNVPPKGEDIKLTISADVQDALTLAMQNHRGAAVVMDATNGEILALASLPSYDPNTLDTDWENLVADAGKPFFNRALQGLYQPGAAMTILWLAQAFQSDDDLSTTFSEPNAPLDLGQDLSVSCLLPPSSDSLTLKEAFLAGCPTPFVNYQATLPKDSYSQIVQNFGLEEAITLAGFPVPDTRTIPTTDPADTEEASDLHLRDVLGQGNLTITPLQMASIMSVIAGDGDAPAAYVLSGIRRPGAEDWEAARPEQSARNLLPSDTAARLRAVFQEAWLRLQDVSTPSDVDVGANIAMSRSGEGTQIWLNGFVAPDGETAAAFVVVLEDTDDIEALVAIGQVLAEALLSL